MPWQSTLRRDITLLRKHERIARELEQFRSELQQDISRLPQNVANVLSYVHDNLFDSALNVNSVKASCRIRNNNISTHFRRTVGLGIREYIEALRMTVASRLLCQRGIEVFLVAMSLGYDHQETFCRAFQRIFGRTPSEHRFDSKHGMTGEVEKEDQEGISRDDA